MVLSQSSGVSLVLNPSHNGMRWSNAQNHRLNRFRARQTSYMPHVKEAFRPLYIRKFAWIGSVEPCTGVLCDTCQSCLRDLLILKVAFGTHHATARSMLAAVRIGCRICTCLWRQFAGFRSMDPEKVPGEMDEEPGDFSQFFTASETSRRPCFVVGKTIFLVWEPSTMNRMVPRIDMFSYQNNHMNMMDQYRKLAEGWLSECLDHHTRCKYVASVEDYCPTRLIDVRANSLSCELRLYSTSNGPIKQPYMTLSHCWGRARILQLTSLTHERLQQGFTLAELPQTFQDAIMVTRALGVNFLWIDALCIIQDSLVDWQHEATMMSQVSSNSRCNLSALNAHDSTEGLFLYRENSSLPYCTVTACRKFRRKRIYEFAYTDVWSDSVQYAPLTRRAWVLQERLLAPRVLHFGKRQLLWECNHLRACEIYPKGMRATNSVPDGCYYPDKFLKESISTILHGVSDSFLASSQMHRVWKDLVQNYTRCNLTMSKDKLVAFSGIVKRLQPLFKTEYLAGLWRDNLPDQLLWWVDNEGKRSLAGGERPEYRAPSWSWASIEAPVVYPSLERRVDHRATIIEAHIIPLTEDATGQVVDGYIRLRPPLFPVDVSTRKGSQEFNLVWAWGELESAVQTIPDVWPRPAVERLQFVLILRTSDPSSFKPYYSRTYGLLLAPVDGKQGVYRRWGMAMLFGKRAGKFWNFGNQLIKGQRTYGHDLPERYSEQVITLI